MLVYHHMYFASCTFADLAKYDFCHESPVLYQSNALVDPLSIEMGDDTIGLNELWEETQVEWDEF